MGRLKVNLINELLTNIHCIESSWGVCLLPLALPNLQNSSFYHLHNNKCMILWQWQLHLITSCRTVKTLVTWQSGWKKDELCQYLALSHLRFDHYCRREKERVIRKTIYSKKTLQPILPKIKQFSLVFHIFKQKTD